MESMRNSWSAINKNGICGRKMNTIDWISMIGYFHNTIGLLCDESHTFSQFAHRQHIYKSTHRYIRIFVCYALLGNWNWGHWKVSKRLHLLNDMQVFEFWIFAFTSTHWKCYHPITLIRTQVDQKICLSVNSLFHIRGDANELKQPNLLENFEPFKCLWEALLIKGWGSIPITNFCNLHWHIEDVNIQFLLWGKRCIKVLFQNFIFPRENKSIGQIQ